MKFRKIFSELAKIVADEAERNPEFQARLIDALEGASPRKLQSTQRVARATELPSRRPSNRRPEPVLDPLSIARDGESALRQALEPLDVERLKDIVAGYGMDPSKLAMKWKDKDKLVDRIVEASLARIRKGSAFRGHDGIAS